MTGIGKLPSSDDFKPKKIPKFGSLRQSSKVSFRTPKRKDDLKKLDDKCGFNEINPTSDLLEKRGRKTGELYLPDPVEVINFNSQALRYDRGLDLEIDKTYKDRNGRQVWSFCSKTSPTGFWEVTTVSGTFLNIPNPNLTIICPRPFKASELLGEITSDGTTFRWSQLQGRAAIISPREGDLDSGVLDPTLVIIGTPEDYDPPILLLLELLDNPLIFRIVQVVTTPTSDNFGKDISRVLEDVAPEFKVLSVVPSPTRPEGAAVYRGEAINFTWNLPDNSEFLVNFSILQNVSGSYDSIDTVEVGSQQYSFEANSYYQIQANFKDLFGSFQGISDTFYWQFPITRLGRIFADESLGSKAIATSNDNAFVDYQLQVMRIVETDSLEGKAIATSNDNAYTNYQLGGIFIG